MEGPTNLVAVKIVLIGDGMVGKTTMVKSFLMGKAIADTSYRRTIGADIFIKETIYNLKPLGDVRFKWLIWDLAGQPIFREVRADYYKGAQAGIAVYDVSRPQTFKNVPFWISEFFKHSGGPKPIILVGNKVDLREKMPCVPPEAGHEYAKKLESMTGFPVRYVEASALNNLNVEETFRNLAQTIVINYLKRRMGAEK